MFMYWGRKNVWKMFRIIKVKCMFEAVAISAVFFNSPLSFAILFNWIHWNWLWIYWQPQLQCDSQFNFYSNHLKFMSWQIKLRIPCYLCHLFCRIICFMVQLRYWGLEHWFYRVHTFYDRKKFHEMLCGNPTTSVECVVFSLVFIQIAVLLCIPISLKQFAFAV